MDSLSPELPSLFLKRLEQLIPSEKLEEVIRSFAGGKGTAFRVNRLKADAAEVQARLAAEAIDLHPVEWYADAFTIADADRGRLLTSSAYREGLIWVQNLSSMIPVLLLDPQPGEKVLDLAAAPGSKTLQIAGHMQDAGEIAAVELVKPRFFKLLENLKSQGATNVRTFLRNGETVWRHRPDYFDRVLLDAPCSTEGRFSTEDPETYRYWSERKIREMSRKQLRLLESAVRSVRPGGRIVYSTCTFAPEENEAVVDAILRSHENLRVVQPTLTLQRTIPGRTGWQGETYRTDVGGALRLIPDHYYEGFFVCVLQRDEE